jgi:hypothetical protein
MALDDVLCDNTLAHVVLFLDYESAVIFSKEISQALMDRIRSFPHIWRDIFERHFFSPPEQEVNYLVENKDRKALFHNLVGKKKEQRAVKQSLNLPNRFFYFVPVTPSDDDDMQIHDPPPVDFDCGSFLLTSGFEGEMIFLDPFDMSLVVHKNCVDNAVKSDEAMMIQGYMDAASVLQHHSNLGFRGEMSEQHIAGAVIDETVYRNHNVEHYRTPPSQILLEAQDYFNVRLEEYFHFTDDRNARRRDENGHLLLHPDDEVEFGYMGIDSKPIMGQDGQVQGTWVGLARFLCSLNVDVDHVCCTEIITWTRNKGQDLFGDTRICRVPGDFFCVDPCPKHQRIYAVFLRGQGPLPVNDPDDSPLGRKIIVAYPLVPADDSIPPTSPRYFSNPEFTLTCSDHVSHVIVDCAGTLLVGTNNGNIEVWKPNSRSGMDRVTLLNVKESVIASAKRFHAETEGSPKDSNVAMNIPEANETEVNQRDDANMAADDGSLPVMIDAISDSEEEGHGEGSDVHMEHGEAAAAENDEDWVPRLCGSPTVEYFHFPNHFPVELCGFVSVQHSRVEGTCLLVWKKPNPGSDFQVVSQIMLPLSPRRKPCVHYDGRSIVVCGQDHIGFIVLVYHVLSSLEDIEYFPSNPEKKKGDESGGVYNYTVQPHLRFANRVRHAALGGLQYYDSMYMTCNERFLIVNTKTGNLLGGGSTSTGEGLLIIDLKEHE